MTSSQATHTDTPLPKRVTLKSQSFFVASPGDVSAERESLQGWLAPHLQKRGHQLFAYEYDAGPFHAGATYQDQIPYPSDELARVTICILGERLGLDVGDGFHLPEGFREWLAEWQRPLGSPISLPGVQGGAGKIPMTGTLFELLDALRAAEREGGGGGRRVLLFIKGIRSGLPTRTWSEHPELEDVSRARKFGMNEEYDRLNELAKAGGKGGADAEAFLDGGYRVQLSYVDALLRILKQKAKDVETFSDRTELHQKLLRQTQAYFRARMPDDAEPWTPSLEAIGSQNAQSLFGRHREVMAICNRIVELSQPGEVGRPWIILTGASGAGKSSVARGGVAGELRQGWWKTGAQVTVVETSPGELSLNPKRAPVLQLATNILAVLGNPSFPRDGDQAAWDRCIDAGHEADPAEVARLIVSVVRPEVGRQTRYLFIVVDQAEEWWGTDGKILGTNKAMLVFLDQLTRSKVVSCLTVLQSESHDRGGRFGGKLQSLRQLTEFQAANGYSPVEIVGPLMPPASLGEVREIVFGVVREQVGHAPEELEQLVQQTGDPLDTGAPFLPLLALRLKRICDAFRAQNLDDGARARTRARSHPKSRLGSDDPFIELGDEVRFTVEPWMVEPLSDELDELGEMAIADLPPLMREEARIESALDLCLTKLVGVSTSEGDREQRSDACICLDHAIDDFGAPDTDERLVVNALVRRRLVRQAASSLRLSHLSTVDKWKRAGRWFDSTADRRSAASRVATLLPSSTTVAAIAENLREPANWQALRKILHHIARDSALVPDNVRRGKRDLIAAMELSFARLSDVSEQNRRINEALAAGLHGFVSSVLSAANISKRLDDDTSPAAAEPLLVRLGRAGLLDCIERAATEGCRRSALSPRTRESVFSLILQRMDTDGDEALRVFHLLDRGRGGKDSVTPLAAAERSAIFDARTKRDQKSLLDFAAMSGSGRAVKLVLSLAADDNARRGLVDPHARGATKALKSPLFLAVEAGKRSAVDVLLNEAKRLFAGADLARYVNSMPARSAVRQRLEPAIVSAARIGSVEIVRALLATGADPAKAGNDLCDAFQVALLKDDTKVLAVLVESGASPSKPPSGFSLSHWAAVLNATKCLAMLVEREVDAPSRDAVGRTALHVACARSRVDAVKNLLSKIPKKQRELWLSARDNRGQSVLPIALRAGRIETVELLLEFPAVARVVNEPDENGYRPLHYAARFCGAQGVVLLCAKGAELDFDLEPSAEITALQVAAMMNDAEACALLTTAQSIQQRNPHGRTALHYAARHGAVDALNQLMSVNQGDLGAKNKEGQTPLHLAAHGGHLACVELLVRSQSGRTYVNDPDEVLEGGRGGRSPLWTAVSAGHDAVVETLVASGAEVDFAAANAMRPIDEACRKGHAGAASILVEAGADFGPGWLHNTPLHYACRGGHLAAYNLIAQATTTKHGAGALTQALRAQTQFGETPLQALARALIRSAAPSRLADSQKDEGYFGEGAEGEAEKEPSVARSTDEGASIDVRGAAAIVKQTLLQLGDALDDRTLNDLALGCAVLEDADVVRTIAAAGVRFNNVRDQFGATPLHLSAKTGSVDVLRELIAAGADVDARAADGGTVLQTLALYSSAQSFGRGLEVLTAAGASIDAVDIFGEAVLHKIAACKSPDLVEKFKQLCDMGANIDLQNADGESPRGVLAHVRRKMAASNRIDLKEEIEILDQAFAQRGGLLCERDSQVARLQRVAYPVHHAIMSSRWDLVPKIMQYGVGHCASAADSNGRTPLMTMASATWSPDHAEPMNSFFDWLVKQSEDLEVRDHTGRSVAHYACLARGPAETGLVGSSVALALLPRKIDLEAVDGLGRTPLHIAAASGNTEAIEWLLSNGQRPDVLDALGNTPAHLAAQSAQDAAYDILGGRNDGAGRKNAIGLSPSEIRKQKVDAIPLRLRMPPRLQIDGELRLRDDTRTDRKRGGIAIGLCVGLLVLLVAGGAIVLAPPLREAILSLVE